MARSCAFLPQIFFLRGSRTQSTYILYRAPQCMSPRRNFTRKKTKNLPQPLSRKRVCPPPRSKGWGGHTRLRLRGWGSSNSDDWRKSLALCLLCGLASRRVGKMNEKLNFQQYIGSFSSTSYSNIPPSKSMY